ncbi:MAG: hypothetical protein WCH75_09355 [Candidatus Binatia bacterium]
MAWTFYPEKRNLIATAVCALIFLAAILGYGSLFFVENAKEHGFKSNWHAAAMGYIGTALFGLMLMLCALSIAAHYSTSMTVDGSTIQVRSLRQNENFDADFVEELRWHQFRRLRLRLPFGIVKLDLRTFSPGDRLSIIRILRRSIPRDKQIGWDEYCHHIALPLRNRQLATIVQTPDLPDLHDDKTRVLITRARYDRPAWFILPFSVIASVFIWRAYAFPAALVIPLFLLVIWIVLRSDIPKQGRYSENLLSRHHGWPFLVGVFSVPLILVLMSVLRVFGYSPDESTVAVLPIAIPGMALMIYACIKKDNQRKVRDAQQLAVSVKRWEDSEAAEP